MPLAFRFAWRELRGGLRGFGIFIACIALGVMAIAGVGAVAQSMADGLARQGSVILGGDLAFTLVQREADARERDFFERAWRGFHHRHAADHGARRRQSLGAG